MSLVEFGSVHPAARLVKLSSHEIIMPQTTVEAQNEIGALLTDFEDKALPPGCGRPGPGHPGPTPGSMDQEDLLFPSEQWGTPWFRFLPN